MDQTLIRRHNQTVLDSLAEGDLVEFPKGLYSHWAVYVGNGEVVHLTGDPNARSCVNANPSHVFSVCGVKFSKAKVRRENFFDVAAGSMAKKNNKRDNTVSPDDKEMIVQRASLKTGDIGYNILWKNCECFAMFCRYGAGWSEQTYTGLWVAGVIVVVIGLAPVIGIIGAVLVGVVAFLIFMSRRNYM